MVALPAERSKVTEQLGLAFAERGYRVLINKGDTDTTLYATKGIMGRVAAHVAHLSVTVIVAGGAPRNSPGFRRFGGWSEGGTYYVPHGRVGLRVGNIWIDD